MNETFEKQPAETHLKAEFMFETLLQVTEGNAAEASSIIMSMLINLWIYGRAPDGDLDNMLEGFTLGVRTNIDMARTNDRRTAN